MHSNFIISLALFLLALIPRLPDLGRFLTADEFLWIDRSRNFLAGLTDPAYQCDSVVEQWQFVAQGLACTLRTGHPGVTTMWTGSFGFLVSWLGAGRPGSLHDYVVAVATNPVDASFIAPERLGTVLITSLWVVAVYWLARRLFGRSTAIVGAILIALNPFHIAYSRVIHHDALSTTFMTLSVLGAFVYWGQKAGRRWLLFSGICAGLAFISKSASLYLMPFIALTGLWFTTKEARNRGAESGVKGESLFPIPYFLLPTILDGLLWFVVAVISIFVVWPAMWVAPLEAVETVLSLGFKYSTGGHAKGNFLLGQVSQDPGVLFYPVTWLYRTSPLVWVGLLAICISWLAYRTKGSTAHEPTHPASSNKISSSPLPARAAAIRPLLPYLPLMLILILGYGLMLTIGEKKQERYFLPMYPWFDLIAAAGIVWIFDCLFGHGYNFNRRRITPYALRFPFYVFIILFQTLLVYPHFPYYFTYFNPLLGGIQGAARAVTIGWGEGLDLAADYLNHHTDPARTRVASWYQSTFAPFYRGQAISYSEEKGKALAGDYVIFYINQTQRRFPDEIIFDYFESRFKPEKVITLQGLDYAWIYPSLGIDHYIQDQRYTGIASLLAWQWVNGDRPLIPGQAADFDLYWEYLGKQPDEPFFFRLVDKQGSRWAEGQSRSLTAENPPPEKWRQGEIIAERGTLMLPPDIPPGLYRLQIGFYTQAPAVTSGELLFTLPEAEAIITVGHAAAATAYQLPVTATPVDRSLGDVLTLLGAVAPPRLALTSSSSDVAASPVIPLDLYWRVERAIPADFSLHVGLMDAGQDARQAWFDLSLAETLNPAETQWQPGDIIHTSWRLDLLPEVPPGTYHFDLVLPDSLAAGQAQNLSFGRLIIDGN
ncbi:MAG: glycosyltransferase family 39 protein [Anaerolineae bacterium]|nr:glycosyltransferase family 39 protein [Anaerolineae bacterium]